jgi:hypothetical protein
MSRATGMPQGFTRYDFQRFAEAVVAQPALLPPLAAELPRATSPTTVTPAAMM